VAGGGDHACIIIWGGRGIIHHKRKKGESYIIKEKTKIKVENFISLYQKFQTRK
jgi:hypothetical protein